MHLFNAPSTCSLACHPALDHAGARDQLWRVDVARGTQRSARLSRLDRSAEGRA